MVDYIMLGLSICFAVFVAYMIIRYRLPHKVKHEHTEYKPPIIGLLDTETHYKTADSADINAQWEQIAAVLQELKTPAQLTAVNVSPSLLSFAVDFATPVAPNTATRLADVVGVKLRRPCSALRGSTSDYVLQLARPDRQSYPFAAMANRMINSDIATDSGLSVALGADTSGGLLYADLCKMPHLLIAGATGSGKSVCINAIINSLLYTKSPDQCGLLLIDPKQVELSAYANIPHLLQPIATNTDTAVQALQYACKLMDERYKALANAGYNNIDDYNSAHPDTQYKKIVVIIDELADLMITAKKQVESYIVRLAQLARAAGIHLVVATQRPTANVVTGLIKANIPSRIAFTVASGVDSRVILDQTGAEKLTGMGDGLFLANGATVPTRFQGCYISGSEARRVADYISQ